MKRRVLSIFCVFALCLGAVPAAASENGAGLWVNGTDLLAEPEHTVECGSGTAEYDPENNVLTLDDAFISTASPDGTGISASGGLTIELLGDSGINGKDMTSGISVSGSVVLTGGGTLSVEGEDYGMLIGGELDVDCGGLYVSGDRAAVSSGGDVTLGGGTVEAAGEYGFLIDGEGVFELERGASLDAECGYAAIAVICPEDGRGDIKFHMDALSDTYRIVKIESNGRKVCTVAERGSTVERRGMRISGAAGSLTVPEPGDGPAEEYDIGVLPCVYGSVSAGAGSAPRGTEVALIVTPDDGYELAVLNVKDGSGGAVPLRTLGRNFYSFTMPVSDVRVSASFSPADRALPFDDVDRGDWFYSAVEYVWDNGLMDGTAPDEFGPDGSMTRGMTAVLLWRMEGAPQAGQEPLFSDVDGGDWFYGAVGWASWAGLVNGSGHGCFDPESEITREQLAVLLYRYAQHLDADVSARRSLDMFADSDKVSPYAADALSWASASGLINGRPDGCLDPQGGATRAETAAMLMRFEAVC